MKIFNQYKGLRKEIYVIFICKVIDKMGGMVGPMMTLILSSKMNFSASQIALFTLMTMIASLPVSLIGGKLTDKYSKKLLINICDITTSILYIVSGVIGISSLTIVLYVIGSLLQMIEDPAYDSLLQDLTHTKDREKAYSLDYLGVNLGLVLAPTIAGFLVNEHLSFMFILNGVTQLLSIIIFDFYIKGDTVVIDNSNKYETQVDDVNTLKIIKDNKELFAFFIIFSFTCLFYQMWGYLIPLCLSNINSEMGSIYYGIMCSVNSIVVVVFTTPISAFISRFTSLTRTMLGVLLELIGFIVFLLFINHPIAYYISITLFTFGEIVDSTTTNPHISKRTPRNYRGRINSISSVMNNCIYGVGMLIIGNIYDSFGSIITWVIVYILGAACIVAYSILKRFDRLRYPSLYKKED